MFRGGSMSMFLDAILSRCTEFYIMFICRPIPSEPCMCEIEEKMFGVHGQFHVLLATQRTIGCSMSMSYVVLLDLMNWCERMPQDYLQISGTYEQSNVSSECLITRQSGYHCQSSKIDKLLRCYRYPTLGPFIYMTPCHQPTCLCHTIQTCRNGILPTPPLSTQYHTDPSVIHH